MLSFTKRKLSTLFAFVWISLLGLFVCSAYAVLPTTYQLGTNAGGYTSDPQGACQVWADEFNATYGIAAQYEGAHFYGFNKFPDGSVIDGGAGIFVVCVGTYKKCLTYGGNVCYEMETNPNHVRVVATGECPAGTFYMQAAETCTCPMGKDWEASVSACVPVRDRNKDQPEKDAPVCNPIYPLTGAKSKSILLTSFSGHEIRLDYSTRKAIGDTTSYFEPGQVVPPPAGAGPMWSINVQKQFYRSAPYQMIYLGGGKWDMFTSVADSEGEKSESYGPDLRLAYNNYSWQVKNKLEGVHYQFSTTGSGWSNAVAPLIAFQPAGGARIELEQDTPFSPNDWRSVSTLKVIKDAFGRQVQLQYEMPPATSKLIARLSSLTDANGTINFSYNDKGMLQRITWPDASYQEFLYEAGQDDKPWLLTGVRDENQALTASYTYDSAGRALSTQAAGGANSAAVSQWQQAPLALPARWYDPVAGVIWRESVRINPQQVEMQIGGAGVTMTTKLVNGMPRIASQSQPAGSGCAAAVRGQDYDANGNVTWRDDFKGYRTCFTNNPDRNLETSRVEGLAAGASCADVAVAGSALPTNARRISRNWHPIWRMETQLAEPRRLTTKVYNGQPDPFNGGATAWCAPPWATLPDGSPMVVLCKQVEQATTDANGALGFAAALDTSVPNRTQQWTYNQYGQVLSTTDPLGNATTSAYYSDTTAEHTRGDLATVTNALSQVTARFTKYNPAGQWLQMVDANGVITTRTFDLRQRLKSVTTNALTTNYDYWPTGLLKTVTMPDASYVSYGYDDAHRLTSITDNLGNSVTYVLDNNGNRISETVTDPSGVLARVLTRVPDALNRIQQVTGRE